jgi:hypothetical protein
MKPWSRDLEYGHGQSFRVTGDQNRSGLGIANTGQLPFHPQQVRQMSWSSKPMATAIAGETQFDDFG